MDFTLGIYRSLLSELQSRGYKFVSFKEYLNICNRGLDNNIIILRHDVDLLPQNALTMALMEYDLGIRGTYYFRIIPDSFNVGVIELIAELGHEVGYHYEDVDLVVKRQTANVKRETANGKRQVSEVIGDRLKVIGDRWQVEVGGRRSEVRGQKLDVRSQKFNGNVEETIPETRNKEPETSAQHPAPDLIDLAMESFVKNLEKMRKIADIKTICMHGSPLSKYDNRLLWTKYDYRDYGIIGEPYFDVDFSQVAYYTDTGRRWDGEAVSVRDKVTPVQRSLGVVGGDRLQVSGDRLQVKGDRSHRSINKPETTPSHLSPNTYHLTPDTCFPKFRTTSEMIKAIEEGRFPQKAMLTIHPQRWHDCPLLWVRELVWQNVKNMGKRLLVRLR